MSGRTSTLFFLGKSLRQQLDGPGPAAFGQVGKRPSDTALVVTHCALVVTH
jgi:hypothetical protein